METSNETASFLRINCIGYDSCEIEIEGDTKALSAAVATMLIDTSPETKNFRDIITFAIMLVTSKDVDKSELEEETK